MIVETQGIARETSSIRRLLLFDDTITRCDHNHTFGPWCPLAEGSTRRCSPLHVAKVSMESLREPAVERTGRLGSIGRSDARSVESE